MAGVRFPVDALFAAWASGKRSSPGGIWLVHRRASIAQMVERKTLNLVVVGSIPTGGAFWRVIEPRDAARVRPLRLETIGKPL